MTPGLRLVDSLPWATRKEDKLPLQAFREALLSSCSGDDALFGTLDDASWWLMWVFPKMVVPQMDGL